MTDRRSQPDAGQSEPEKATERRDRRDAEVPPADQPPAYPDPVDDALDDSFPASDPPQWWGGD